MKRPLLRIARILTGLSQVRLGEATGIAAETISRIETGERDPTPEQARRIAAAFGMPTSNVFPELGSVDEQ